MTAELAALALALIVGAAAARLVGGGRFAGLWYLYGTGAVAVALHVLPWSRATAGAMAIAALAALLVVRRRPVPSPRIRVSPVDIGTAFVIAAFAAFATVARLWEWDAWAIWALKARVFFEHHGIDWQFLEAAPNSFAHPDYPLLVPGALSLPAILGGTWDDRWIGIVTVAFLASATLAIREITSREFSPAVSASMALAFAAIASSRYVSTAETPFMAFSVCALAFLRAGELRHAAILFGLAAITKNEGLALLGAVAIGLVLMRRVRDVPRLWPAVVILAPWTVLRLLHPVPNDVIAGPLLDRFTAHVREAGRIVDLLASNADPRWLWIALLIAIPVAVRREPLLFIIIGIQAAVAIAVYFVTPHDLAWHIGNSWNRVSRQLAAMGGLAVMSALAANLRGKKVPPPAAPNQAVPFSLREML